MPLILTRRRWLAGVGSAVIAAGCASVGAAPDATLTANPPAFDPVRLRAALAKAAEEDQLHSLIIARHGEIHATRTFRGPGIDAVANVKSVSKTLIAALTGIAIDRGIFQGVEQPLVDIIANRVPDEADPRVANITLDHLLTMRAGLERTSGSNYGAWVSSSNWVRYILSRPFVAEPGGPMLYSTGSFHLLAAALTEASGRSVLDLARDWLGQPLDTPIPPWTRDPQGIYMGGNNMGLTPRGMYRFGEVYRRGGTWNDQRIMSQDWVQTSWEARTRSPWSGDQYGYGWFIADFGGTPARYARGYGGQMIYVLPDLAITVVVTSDPNRPARSAGYAGSLRRWVAEDVVAAAV